MKSSKSIMIKNNKIQRFPVFTCSQISIVQKRCRYATLLSSNRVVNMAFIELTKVVVL